MKPEWCDEKTWGETLSLVSGLYLSEDDSGRAYIPVDEYDTIARALLTARQEGRKAGLEEAAGMVERSGSPAVTLPIASAIRKAGEA